MSAAPLTGLQILPQYLGLELFRVDRSSTCNASSHCFRSIATANLVKLGEKISLLTCEHVFQKEPTEYLFILDNQAINFRFSIQEITTDQVLVPIGIFDEKTSTLKFQTNGTLSGAMHIHSANQI